MHTSYSGHMIRGNEEMKKMGGDYLKKCQPQIAGEDVLWLVSSDPKTPIKYQIDEAFP